MKLTKEIVLKAKSSNGGFSKNQLNILGVEWIRKGWLKESMKKEFTKEQIDELIRLKDLHLSNGNIKM
jgi:hypothetical protein